MKKGILTAAGFLTAAVLTLWGCGDEGADRQAGQGSGEQAQQVQMEDSKAQDSEAQERTEMAVDANAQDEETQPEPADAQDEEAQPEPEPVQLKGTTFSVMGDSISTYEGYNPEGFHIFFPQCGDVEDVKDTWWQQVADDLEATLLANSSSSGATVAGDSTGTDNPQCACNELRTDGLAGADGACPDRIIVYLGTNDMIEAVPLGDNDGTRPVDEGEVTIFSDAYTLMLDKMHAKYPKAEIYCCTLPHIGNYGTETPYVEFVNGIGLSAKDYSRVIAKIAKTRGLPVIDLYHCGIKIGNLQEMTSDGVHPTVEGMNCIAEAVKKAITE